MNWVQYRSVKPTSSELRRLSAYQQRERHKGDESQPPALFEGTLHPRLTAGSSSGPLRSHPHSSLRSSSHSQRSSSHSQLSLSSRHHCLPPTSATRPATPPLATCSDSQRKRQKTEQRRGKEETEEKRAKDRKASSSAEEQRGESLTWVKVSETAWTPRWSPPGWEIRASADATIGGGSYEYVRTGVVLGVPAGSVASLVSLADGELEQRKVLLVPSGVWTRHSEPLPVKVLLHNIRTHQYKVWLRSFVSLWRTGKR